ncbi:MAG: translation initiation factor IF-3, partial [Chloroflexi bacterium]|nr:translation initiation factor IF-3 [Chloroflexota bacterium]
MAREYRVNDRIRIAEVRLVAEDGTQLGVMPTRDALALAREQDLDLVEVAPNSVPPVCRLLDYGKFRYLQSTKEREMRKGQKSHGMREVRFRPKIGQHDIDFKARLVKRLLGEGNKVKVSVMFRGREIAHPEIAVNLLRQVHDGLKDESKLEQAPNLEGRFMSIILTPVAAASKPAVPAAVATAEPEAATEPEAAGAATAEPAAAAQPAVAAAEQAEPQAAAEPEP